MGQFKPMVKMMTTEPTVELKLKKGGHVSMKHGGGKHGHKMMDGGVMSALAGAPAPVGSRGGLPAAARPAAPGMAARRRAMMGRPMMAEGGETKAEHKAEMEAIKGVDRKLSKHAAQAASKAHKGLKTGGVVMGQGGFAKGGIIKTEGQGGAYRNTKMHTAEGEDRTPKKTGEVVMGKPGGYKKGGKAGGGSCYAKGGGVEGNVSTSKPGKTNTTTGEVKKGNAGGYKKGGAPKKSVKGSGAKAAARYADGGEVDFFSMPAYQRGSYGGMSEAPSMASQFGGSPSSDDRMSRAFSAMESSPGVSRADFARMPSMASQFADMPAGPSVPEGALMRAMNAYEASGQPLSKADMPSMASYYSAPSRSDAMPRSAVSADRGYAARPSDSTSQYVGTSSGPRVSDSDLMNAARLILEGRGSEALSVPRLPYKMATGGAVNDSGRPVAYPKKAASAPVKNNLQSGTFKRGGKVKMAEGGKLEDLSKGAYDKSIGPSEAEMDIARTIRNMPKSVLDEIKRAAQSSYRFVSGQPESGSVTKTEKSVTVTPAKRRGGSVKR